MCYGLSGDLEQKRGQIVHVNRDPSDIALENLAFLCLDHHDEYDSMPRQTTRLTADELRAHREELYATLAKHPLPEITYTSGEAEQGNSPSTTGPRGSETISETARPRILVFEDSQVARNMFRKRLRKRADLFFAGDRSSIAEQFDRVDPDLVITDLNLGGSAYDGLHLVNELKDISNVPIVVCSKYIFPDANEGQFAGMEEIVARALPEYPSFPTADELLAPLTEVLDADV